MFKTLLDNLIVTYKNRRFELTQQKALTNESESNYKKHRRKVEKMKYVFSLLIVLSAATYALAQEKAPKVEVFGGYSYQQLEAEDFGINQGLNGWNASANFGLSKNFGFKADLSGHYASVKEGTVKADVSDFTFLFGPQYSFRNSSRVTPFAHALFGGSRGKIESGSRDVTETGFASAFGGGLDYSITNRVAVRLIQADYVVTKYANDSQGSVRIGGGLVFRF